MRILLTGAAGLIGGEVAQRLTMRGHAVTTCVYRNREVRGNDGSLVPMAGNVIIDLTAPDLGLSEEQSAQIAENHDVVIHCAASVRFDLTDEDYHATNVVGTAAVLALARRGNIPVLHVSTAYVCGYRNGPILEDEPLPANGFANGYEASKAAAEALVRAADPRHVIARPSIVVGDSQTGAIRNFDTIYAAFKLIAHGKVRHIPASADATLDFVPIDHVASALVSLAENLDAAAGQCIHLVSGSPVPIGDWVSAIASYPQFTPPQLVQPSQFDAARLPAGERRLFNRVAGLYSSYFQRDPRFDDRNQRLATGIICPPTGQTYLRRLIDHCIDSGFLSAAT